MRKVIAHLPGFIILFFTTELSAQATIGTGTQVVCNGNINLVLENLSLTNNGNFNAGTGTAYFNGNSNQFVSGTSPTAFNNLSVGKAINSRVLLQRNIDVNGNIIFTSGLLDMNNFNIILSPSSLVNGENENGRITGTNGGYIQITISPNAVVSVNAGNLGATISSMTNLGTTVIRRGHAAQVKGAITNFSINRYYDINPANNTALNASLKFSYFDAEVNGKNETDFWLWKSSDFTNWFVSATTDTRDATANYVTAKGINSFSRWTLSDASFPTGTFGSCDGKNELKFWPNPYTDDFNLGVTSTKTSSATMLLFDANGKLAASQAIAIRTGRNLFNFSFPKLPAGFYIIKIADSDCSMTVGRIIKLPK
jgi:hypothetical protein